MARDLATSSRADRIHTVISAATRWTFWLFFHVGSRAKKFIVVRQITVCSSNFHAPNLLGRFNLREILDTNLLLGIVARFDEVGYRNRDQQSEDRDHDHNLDQREAPSAGLEPGNFHRFCFSRVSLAKQA